MISKLPKWVWLGGALLALSAGMVNAVGFLSFQHQGVTHLTGVTTQLGASIASAQWSQMIHLIAVIFSFLFGTVFSGFLIQESVLRLGRRYGVALLIESGLLFSAVYFLKHQRPLGSYMASFACGLQNAMATTYSGAVLRTTHVSGIFTDLGILLGQILRRIKVDQKRLLLGLILLVAFFAGSVLGALCFEYFSYQTLYFPSALTGTAGLTYTIYYYFNRH